MFYMVGNEACCIKRQHLFLLALLNCSNTQTLVPFTFLTICSGPLLHPMQPDTTTRLYSDQSIQRRKQIN